MMMSISAMLSRFPRWKKQVIVIFVDVSIVIFSLWFAFILRMDNPSVHDKDLVVLYALAPVLAVFIFARLGLYRSIYRYAGLEVLWTVAKAVGLYAVVFGTALFLIGSDSIPRSIIIINGLLVSLLIGVSRTLPRYLFSELFSVRSEERKRVLIYGAGAAGRQLASALLFSSELVPAAFIDDDLTLHGKNLGGLSVYARSAIESVIDKYKVSEVLLAIPSASRSRRQEIVSVLDQIQIEVRSLPGLADLASGRIGMQDLRRIEIGDILGRDAVKPDPALLRMNITSKSVMVTGAGGSIGSELCRQIVELEPKILVLYEHNEYSLYAISRILNDISKNNCIRIVHALGSVLDRKRLDHIIRTYSVQTVYHAAAYKHVPLVESNAGQGVLNNILGTKIIAESAIANHIASFVLISTDKAVRPTSVMGASKRMAELVVQYLSHQDSESSTQFTIVRFGNVLGSSGSVVPLFRDQIRRGGPVTVTHADVTRYFMTIPEASQLVIQAGAMGDTGDIFLLDMGESIKIMDLARRMIRLSGLEVKDDAHPDGDIAIKITGLRPGEKLFEELLIGQDSTTSDHPLIWKACEHQPSLEKVDSIVSQLELAVNQDDDSVIADLLMQEVKEFDSQEGVCNEVA